jgi:hypothetical protein
MWHLSTGGSALPTPSDEDVGAECQRLAMDVPNSRQRKMLHGIELRYLVTMNLAVHGPATVVEIVELLEYQGFVIAGRASKTVSDALRWELRRGRVRRIRRGKYGPGRMPRSTEHYIHKRAIALREA